MAEFMLHIIKVNVLSAVIIFIVLAVSRLLDKKYSSRWKYLIWLFVSVFLLIPVRLPSNARGLTIEVPKQITRTEYAGSTNAFAAETAKIPTDSTKNSSNEQTMTNEQADMQDSAGEKCKRQCFSQGEYKNRYHRMVYGLYLGSGYLRSCGIQTVYAESGKA